MGLDCVYFDQLKREKGHPLMTILSKTTNSAIVTALSCATCNDKWMTKASWRSALSFLLLLFHFFLFFLFAFLFFLCSLNRFLHLSAVTPQEEKQNPAHIALLRISYLLCQLFTSFTYIPVVESLMISHFLRLTAEIFLHFLCLYYLFRVIYISIYVCISIDGVCKCWCLCVCVCVF